jgi:hypothetical protein
MAGGIKTKEISNRYPVPSSTGVGANDYHKDRQINLTPSEASHVFDKEKIGIDY